MPTFFSTRSDLTPAQDARWDLAVERYNQVIQANAAKGLQHMASPEPGPKSSLFWRLLNDGPVSVGVPPLSHGYPFTALLQDKGPVTVSLRSTERETRQQVVLNQCPWTVIADRTNAAGQIILFWLTTGQAVPREELERILAQGPEIGVSFGKFSGTVHVTSRAYEMQRSFYVDEREERSVSLAEMDVAFLNSHVARIVRAGEHPADAFQKQLSEPGDVYPAMQAMFLEQSREELPRRIEAFESDPAQFDRIEIVAASWGLTMDHLPALYQEHDFYGQRQD